MSEGAKKRLLKEEEEEAGRRVRESAWESGAGTCGLEQARERPGE